MLPSYPSLGAPPGSGMADDGGGEGFRMLRPVSDGEEEGDEDEDVEEIRRVPFESRDLDVRNRKWRRKIEHALVKLTTEVAALREQIEAKRIGDGRRRNGLWALMTWVAWFTVQHLIVDLALLGLLVTWARRKEDRRVDQGLQLLLRYVQHRIRKARLPGNLQLPD